MDDPGLEQAIRAVGGVTELARRVGISQPSVSNWARVPAERLLAVEAVTGVAREILRPDLYAQSPDGNDPLEHARGEEYALLAVLLGGTPDDMLLKRIGTLIGDATPLGLAHAALAEAVDVDTAKSVAREYFDLFIGVGRGELLPYGSYYLSGFLNERPLARLRDDLRLLGIEGEPGRYDTEDHAAALCEIMAGFGRAEFDASHAQQRQFFVRHIDPWMGRFFDDLQSAEAAKFYRRVGALGSVLIEIEREGLALLE
jgi:TorA maturation chaperone TorD